MPISFEQPAPFSADIYAKAGQAGVMQQNNPVLANIYESQSRAMQGYAGLEQQKQQFGQQLGLQQRAQDIGQQQFGQQMGQRAYEFNVSQRFQQQQLAQQAAEYAAQKRLQVAQLQQHGYEFEQDKAMQKAGMQQAQQQFLINRMPSPKDAWMEQAKQANEQQTFQLQGQLQQNQLTWAEQIRMQRMQNAMAAVDQAQTDGTLLPGEAGSLKMQIQTGLDPLTQRQQAAQIAQTQLQTQLGNRHLLDMESTAQDLASFRARGLQDRTQVIQPFGSKERVTMFETSPGHFENLLPHQWQERVAADHNALNEKIRADAQAQRDREHDMTASLHAARLADEAIKHEQQIYQRQHQDWQQAQRNQQPLAAGGGGLAGFAATTEPEMPEHLRTENLDATRDLYAQRYMRLAGVGPYRGQRPAGPFTSTVDSVTGGQRPYDPKDRTSMTNDQSALETDYARLIRERPDMRDDLNRAMQMIRTYGSTANPAMSVANREFVMGAFQRARTPPQQPGRPQAPSTALERIQQFVGGQ